jgi:hypothetical protein
VVALGNYERLAEHEELINVRRNFWKATLISLGAYSTALCAGFWADFRITLFVILALQVTWTLFCIIRTIQLRLNGGHKPDALPDDQEGYDFALGGAVSSVALLAVMIVLSQVV